MWIALAACGSSSSSSAPPSPGSGSAKSVTLDVVPGTGKLPKVPPPPSTAPSGLCELGKEAVAALTTCDGKPVDGNITKAKQQFVGVIDLARKQSPGADLETTCAQMLRVLDDELAKVKCPLPLSAGARTRMYALIDAYYKLRTAVVPTGDAAADAKIAAIAKIRDAACACTTELCLDAVGKQIDGIGALPANAPARAIELAGKLLDDVGRCGAAITHPVPK